jgi:predicted AlkP superfamily phosphohydrolase/phosphomutase
MINIAEKNRVIAIGLDSAEWRLIEPWMQEGHLPNLQSMMKRGLFSKVVGGKGYAAESPWTACLTGCKPETTGYWSPANILADYRVDAVGAYDYDGCRVFYDYCPDRKIIAFDVPHARISDRMSGVQVLAWGAHSPQGPSGSQPPELFDAINEKFGTHPGLHNDDILVWETDTKTKQLEQDLITGMERRTEACLHLMTEKDWDLTLVVYGEVHSAGHGFWHLSQQDHPLSTIYGDTQSDALLNVYKATDRAIGRFIEAAPDDAVVMVFSQEGMKTNSSDLPSWLFLPELLYRHSFEGRVALAAADGDSALPPYARLEETEWLRAIWALKADDKPLRRLIRRHCKFRISQQLEKLWPDDPLSPAHPLDGDTYRYMPQMWYRRLWPRMKAFALPSFSDGYVRINLAGREQNGIIAPEQFDATLDEICGLLSDLKCARTGGPMIKELIRTRTSVPAAGVPCQPDADLIIIWTDTPTNVIDSPAYGRIGPAPFRRTGDHYNQGFFLLNGPGIDGREMPSGELVDIAPTILDLMGVPTPNHFDGRSRLRDAA